MRKWQKGEIDGDVIIGAFYIALFMGIIWGIEYIFTNHLGIILIIISAIISISLYIWLIIYVLGLFNEKKIQKPSLIGIIGISAIVLISAIWYGKNLYQSTIGYQISSTSEMQQKLESQIRRIQRSRSDYSNQIQNLKKEIQDEKNSYGISSLSNATDRMKYNIRLIQEQDGYLTKLSEIEKITKNGLEETIYMKRRLEARKPIMDVVADGKNMGREIDTLLKTYTPYAEGNALNPKDLKFRSLEEVWQIYIR